VAPLCARDVIPTGVAPSLESLLSGVGATHFFARFPGRLWRRGKCLTKPQNEILASAMEWIVGHMPSRRPLSSRTSKKAITQITRSKSNRLGAGNEPLSAVERWRQYRRPHFLRSLANTTAGLPWSTTLLEVLIEEMHIDEALEQLLECPLHALPRSRFPKRSRFPWSYVTAGAPTTSRTSSSDSASLADDAKATSCFDVR
jgi:hypothetical protein